MIPGLYTYVATAIVAGALAFGGGWKVQAWRYDKQIAVINADHAKEREAAATALALATTKARETEQTLTHQAEKIKEETHAQIADLDARATTLARRLRDAAATNRLMPSAAEGSTHTETQPGDYIARFSEQAGANLVAEAERGETVRIALLACYKQYDAVRAALSDAGND